MTCNAQGVATRDLHLGSTLGKACEYPGAISRFVGSFGNMWQTPHPPLP